MKDTTQMVYRYMTHINGSLFVSNRTKITSSTTCHLHFHNGCEVLFITQGSYKLYAPEKIYEGSGPCIAMFQSGMYHSCVFTNCEESPANRYVINYTQDLLEMIPSHMIDTKLLFDTDVAVIPLDDHSFHLLSVLFEELLALYTKQTQTEDTHAILPQIYGYMTVILNAITDSYRRTDAVLANSRKNHDEYIYKVLRELLKAVEDNESVSAEAMAARFFVSRTKLWEDFRRITGKNFKQMTDELRLEHIKNKLCLGLSNKEIAQQCGFSSESYFIQFFKKHMDISPGDYRNQNRVM